MSEKSKIQWTDSTWNIARGCTKVDADCKFCYMYRDSMNGTRYNAMQVQRTKTVFNAPLKYPKGEPSKCWEGPQLVFTSSLTDFFHQEIDSYRNEAWDIIRQRPDLIFQILTKRPERIAKNLPADWNENFTNCWIGTSVGSEQGMTRMYDLMDAFNEFKNGGIELRKPITFISFEPLHEHIPMNLDIQTCVWFDWIIIGGESGNENGKYRYRPCKVEWMEEIAEEFSRCGCAVFVKQMGTHLSKELKMTDRHGGNFNEFPKSLQLREFPKQQGNKGT